MLINKWKTCRPSSLLSERVDGALAEMPLPKSVVEYPWLSGAVETFLSGVWEQASGCSGCSPSAVLGTFLGCSL